MHRLLVISSHPNSSRRTKRFVKPPSKIILNIREISKTIVRTKVDSHVDEEPKWNQSLISINNTILIPAPAKSKELTAESKKEKSKVLF